MEKKPCKLLQRLMLVAVITVALMAAGQSLDPALDLSRLTVACDMLL